MKFNRKEYNKKYYQENKEAKKEASKKYYQENKEALKEAKQEWKLKYNYNITLDEYDLNLELQDNACKICKTDASELSKKLAVDHCHDTGAVRGLLCNKCNVGLGQFNDDAMLLETALTYLQTSTFHMLVDELEK